MRAVAFAAALFIVLPGHPDVPLAGLPLGQSGTVLLVGLIGGVVWARGVPAWPVARPVVWALVSAIVLKVLLAILAAPSGWLASYYANGDFSGAPRRSTDYVSLVGTRIDRRLTFGPTSFPVHFFNDSDFNFGIRREVSEPFSAHWRGYLRAEEPVTVNWDGTGEISVQVDGQPAPSAPAVLPAGHHVVDVRFVKPAQTDGAFRFQALDAHGRPRDWRLGEVTPRDEPEWRRAAAGLVAPLGWAVLLVVLTVTGVAVWPSVATRLRGSRSVHDWIAPAVFAALTAQGAWKARHLVGQVWTLSGGDDWLAFEMSARDALLNGWLMTRGAATAPPFFSYPGYSYYLAAVHLATGESLAGVVLMNFIVLAAATQLVYAIARQLTSPPAAVVAVAILVVLEQLDFVRYYTVTLLSENLFVLLVPATIYFLIRFVHTGRWPVLLAAGACGGLATATRPTMLLYLPVAMLVTTIARIASPGRRLAAAALLAAGWLLAISPFTYRNYAVSGEPVLVTSGQSASFIRYNLPASHPDARQKYLDGFDGGNLEAGLTLLRILGEYPVDTVRNWLFKIGFAAGMVHWAGNSPHPELVITTLLYLAAILLVPQLRTAPAMFVHGFILTHLMTLLLTEPWNYGYRMLLAMYLLMPIAIGGLIASRVRPAPVVG